MRSMFKNENERRDFLKNYRDTSRGWYLWKEDADLERRWWRYDHSATKVSIVVEEEFRTLLYPATYQTWLVRHYYILDPYFTKSPRTFGDYVASMTLARMEVRKWTVPDEEG